MWGAPISAASVYSEMGTPPQRSTCIGARPFPRLAAWARVLLAAVIVILIILIAILSPRVRDFERFLSGFWTGDPAFLERAGLSEMCLYIAPCERAGGRWCRQGYLVMVDTAGNMVSNQGIEIAYGCLLGRWGSALKSHFSADAQETYRVPCVEVAYDDDEVMPAQMRLGLNVTEGTVALYDDGADGKIYAFLVKDNETSIAANAEYMEDRCSKEGGGPS